MAFRIYARIKPDGAGHLVRMIIKDVSDSGEQIEEKNSPTIALIQEFRCYYQNEIIFEAILGNAASKDPYLSFRLERLQLGQSIKLVLQDGQGNQDQVEIKIP